MSQQLFISPRLVGKRFSEHSIPLEFLKDLAVIEEMIIEVAKWHFRQDHPDRKCSPRGFTDGISLNLARINSGSAIADIVLVTEDQVLFPSENQIYFEKARNSIIKAIGAAERSESVHSYLPENLLGYFDRFGRSLKDEEAIEFCTPDLNETSKLNKNSRRRLILASSQVQELTEEVTIRGIIPEADQGKKTFQIMTRDGSKLVAPMEPQHRDTVLEAFNGFENGLHVLLHGIGKFNRLDKLQSIESVEHIGILDPNDIAARIEELNELRDGWFNGFGFALNKEGLVWLLNKFDTYYPEELLLPYLYPTSEGKVQAEWTIANIEISLEIDIENHQGEWQGLEMTQLDECFKELNLNNEEDWQWVTAKIRGLLQVGEGEASHEQ
ncbi:MAG: hypothetical protein PHT25_09895 [Bacteroidales bacterium]|nr:hypothetical protein [Bacteroidales bacterium]